MKRKQCNNHLVIPQDIITSILLLLPFESVLEYKRVSKEWKHLINDSKFSKLYRDTSSMALFVSERSLYCLLIRHKSSSSSNNINVAGSAGCRHPPFTVHNIPAVAGRACELVSESPSAMACVRCINGDLLFYNLLTGASYAMDAYGINKRLCIFYGFGYDRDQDDYKLGACIPKYRQGRRWLDNSTDNALFWVYSCRDGVWKAFHNFPYAAYNWTLGPQPHSFNGVLHWVVTKINGSQPLILTYDLRTRKLREISTPPMANNLGLGYVYGLSGQLCYLAACHNGSVHMWVLKQPNKSWMKLVTIDKSCRRRHKLSLAITPIALSECGDGSKIVLFISHPSDHKRLFWYDINKDEIKTIWQKQDIKKAPKKTRLQGVGN